MIPSTAQPPPEHVPGAASVHDLVCADLPDGPLRALLVERRAFGLAKYGVPLQVAEPNRVATQDLLEELGDAVVYGRRGLEQGTVPPGFYARLLELAEEAAALWYRPG